MDKVRLLRAVLLAPVVAAIATVLLWGLALVAFADWVEAEPAASGIGATAETLSLVGFMFLAALVVATAAEVLVVLPLFFLFRHLGWLSPAAFLLGGLVASVVACLVVKHASSHVSLTVWLGYAIPGLVGAYAFGYIGGWLPNEKG
jgi:hypothetical protein